MEGVSVTTPSMAQGTTANSSVFSPLLISMLGIVVTTIAIMAYHLLLVKYCIRRYAASAAAAQSDAAAKSPPTAVDEEVLQTIPILAFAAAKRDAVVQAECVVCLGELEEEDAVRVLPNCNHAFHVSCIDQWFAAHANCPMCRSSVMRQETNASPDLHTVEVPNCAGDGGGEAPPPPIVKLERSLSMSHCWAVVIDVQGATPFSSSDRGRLGRSESFSRQSVANFECGSQSKWRRSLSNGAILPL